MAKVFAFLIVVLLLSACAPQVNLRGCNGVLVAANEIVTAAHCVSPHSDTAFINLPRAQGETIPRHVKATLVEMDAERDVARLALSTPILSPYYATYREPHVGATGYVIGNCPFRHGSLFRVMAAERVVGSDGIPRWEWLVRGGAVSCPGDSGSPVWSDTELGVYYGTVSRFERLRTTMGEVVILWKIGASIYSGAGE